MARWPDDGLFYPGTVLQVSPTKGALIEWADGSEPCYVDHVDAYARTYSFDRFYHISPWDLGPTYTFVPRVPQAGIGSECSRTQRVCFAPTLWQCIYAIGGCGNETVFDALSMILTHHHSPNTRLENPAVYTIDSYTHPIVEPPVGMSDFAETDEHWAVTETKCKRAGYLDVDALLSYRLTWKLTRQKQAKTTRGDFTRIKDARRAVQERLDGTWKPY